MLGRLFGVERDVVFFHFLIQKGAMDAMWSFFGKYLNPVTPDANEAGWTSLFNGKNLDGWVVKCLPQDHERRGYWKVVDGTITAEVLRSGLNMTSTSASADKLPARRIAD